ncbi:hypothetical protein F4808DRAFT_71649 [Astrocystis sublimbata]|nr:hypothetical protein F4808DRAFT_71649 [Astrocystis sublimbata]
MSVSSRRGSGSSMELARQRDLNRYYQPWLDFKELQDVPVDTPPRPDEDQRPRCSPDATLTAFAQLAALRLNVKRGMVSLIETQTQIILAEATQTLSLVDETRHAPGDHIWLGNVSIPRRDAMDEHTLGAITIAQDAEGRDVEVSAFVVNDTLLDDRFKTRPYVTSDLGVRFYAGVPIVTKMGHSIGVYAVSDTRPRPEGLTYDQLLFMRDVSQIIAAHLERVMGSVARISDRDFIRGVSYFLEDLSEYKYKIGNNDSSTRETKPAQSSETKESTAADSQIMPPPGRSEFADPFRPSSKSSNASSTYPPSRISSKQGSNSKNGAPKDATSTSEEVPGPYKKNVRKIFAHASQLLCDQAKATGCLFVDAASGLFHGQTTAEFAPLNSHDSWPTANGEPPSAASEGSNNGDHTPGSKSDLGEAGDLFDSAFGDSLDAMADVLSLSLADDNSDEHLLASGIIKRRGLRNCIVRYPFGKCFHLNKGHIIEDNEMTFDEVITGGGPTHTSDTFTKVQELKDSTSLSLPQEVLKHIPDAKWLIFLPLFNYLQGQWCAAGFIWGNDYKMGDVDDVLPYLKTFGSCMMSEVASMDVLNTNVAKTTFIASISHDLRSPLHGLLGNLEFLEGTLTSAYQASLVGAIETCGKTLLDTIDHLLDYAKINNLKWASSSKREKRLRDVGTTCEESSALTTFDLGILLEEVVEAVFAGQTFRKMKIRQRDSHDREIEQIASMSLDDETPLDEQIHQGSAKFTGKVLLILNIEKTSWFFQGQTGALRRVIMNVVGNAIKYCTSGFIEISLRPKQITSSKVDVELVVEDTGIGMSDEFLANHVFKPFSQENSFSAGTGLGLNITSQIVSNLHGKITIASEKDVGTNVSITLPMEVAPPPIDGYEHQDLDNALDLATGKKVCILYPGFSDPSLRNPQLSKLESSVSAMFQEWFGMEVIQSQNVNPDSDVAIYVYAEPPPIEHLVEKSFKRQELGLPGVNSALLIISTNAFEAAALQAAGIKELTALGKVIEVISQPVGVQKLARVLIQCLQRVKEVDQKESDSIRSQAALPSPSLPNPEAQKRPTGITRDSSMVVYDPVTARYRPPLERLKWKSEGDDTTTSKGDNLQNSSSQMPPPTTAAAEIELPSHVKSHDAQPPPIIEVQSPENTTMGPQPRVLLVDDNAINLKLLTTFVKKFKLFHAEAINGLEAVNKFKEASKDGAPFDVVLMDLQMPIMNGLEATREIREYEQKQMNQNQTNRKSHIVAITGVGDDETRQEAMDAGVTEYLIKPVRLKVLQRILFDR